MRAVGYGRISDADDDNETSLTNQRNMVEEYAEEHDLTLVDWYRDRNVSGKVHPAERDGFNELLTHLREDEELNTVLVKNGKRLARGLSSEDVKNWLLGQMNREIEFVKTHPEGFEEQVDEMKNAEEGTNDWTMAPAMEGMKKSFERQEIAQAREAGKLTAQRKKQAGELYHRPPFGLTTDEDGGVEPESLEMLFWIHKFLNRVATSELSPGQVASRVNKEFPGGKLFGSP